MQHVPDQGEHLVRYYGWYSNRRRDLRKQLVESDQTQITANEAPINPAKAAWTRLIQVV